MEITKTLCTAFLPGNLKQRKDLKMSKSKTVRVDARKGTKRKSSPKGVTQEPQHDEHMHLKYIAHSPALTYSAQIN
jgi:hypothetical protein